MDRNSPEPAAEASPRSSDDDDDDDAASLGSSAMSTEATERKQAEDPTRTLRAALKTATAASQFVRRKANHPSPKEETSIPYREKAPLDDHLKPGAHPFGKPTPAQSHRKCNKEIAKGMDGQVDVDNVLKFCCWGKDHFTVLYELFRYPDTTGKYMSCRAVPVEEFAQYLGTSGFKGDCLSIIGEIYKSAPPGAVQQMSHTSIGAPQYEITMPMLHKFIRDHQHLTEGLEWSPVNEFKRDLLKQRGSYLRAWRLDIDVLNTGTVPYMKFIQACHKLQHGHHSQAIWNSFRKDETNAPLEFVDFAPEESANLDAFTQSLWVSVDFNMCKAWEVIDVTERLWVSEQEFVDGAKQLGFNGDARALYKGLDTYGHGRLWRREVEYLKILFNASSRTPHGTPQMKVLRAWARASFGTAGVEGFLIRLGLGEGEEKSACATCGNIYGAGARFCRKCGQARDLENNIKRGEATLTADELVAGLEQLNYPGDCVQTAHLVARAAGTQKGLDRKLLVSLLSGERPAAPTYLQRTIVAGRTATTPRIKKSTSSPTVEQTKTLEVGWDGSVTDLCTRNEDKPSVSRSYFSYERPLQSGEVAPSFRSLNPGRKAWTLPGQKQSDFTLQPSNETDSKSKSAESEDERRDRKEKKAKKEKKEKKEKKATPGAGRDLLGMEDMDSF